MKKWLKKKGLSTVVTTLILIAISLVVIVGVGIFIKNFTQEEADFITADGLTLDVQIMDVEILSDTNMSVKVKRNPGGKDIAGVIFVVYDENNTEVHKRNVPLDELERRNFEIILQVLNTSYVHKITVSPIFETNSGKEVISPVEHERIVNPSSGGGSSSSSSDSDPEPDSDPEELTTCDLTNMLVSPGSATEGESVRIVLSGINCDGDLLNIDVFEQDLVGGDDLVLADPIQIEFSENGFCTFCTSQGNYWCPTENACHEFGAQAPYCIGGGETMSYQDCPTESDSNSYGFYWNVIYNDGGESESSPLEYYFRATVANNISEFEESGILMVEMIPQTCSDGIQNQDETGIDCGGSCEDCPNCNDGIQNQDETGIDCGGVCSACPLPLTCEECIDADPNYYWCGEDVICREFTGGSPSCGDYNTIVTPNSGTCLVETCNDGIQNQDETGIDCGGSCEDCPSWCDFGTPDFFCNYPSENCITCPEDCGECPTCSDGIWNGEETGVDCGGSCPACGPTCYDGIQNGEETGVDCGGSCEDCPNCNDGILNQGELNIDCGGPNCPVCNPTCESCLELTGFLWCSNSDNGEFCAYDDLECEDQNGIIGTNCPTCVDGILNQGEIGIDCGGPNCPACYDDCGDGMCLPGEAPACIQDCGNINLDECVIHSIMWNPLGNYELNSDNNFVVSSGQEILIDFELDYDWGASPETCGDNEIINFVIGSIEPGTGLIAYAEDAIILDYYNGETQYSWTPDESDAGNRYFLAVYNPHTGVRNYQTNVRLSESCSYYEYYDEYTYANAWISSYGGYNSEEQSYVFPGLGRFNCGDETLTDKILLYVEPASCFDQVQNQDETEVDCGGSCMGCFPTVYFAQNGIEIMQLDHIYSPATLTLNVQSSELAPGETIEFEVYDEDTLGDDYLGSATGIVQADYTVSAEWVFNQDVIDAAENWGEGSTLELYFTFSGMSTTALEINYS